MSNSRKGEKWNWDETLAAFRLYCHTPYGRLHQLNPDIIALAEALGRTPSAVGMKACNFASLDPHHRARGIKGLVNRSGLEEELWDRFLTDSETVAAEAEEAFERIMSGPLPPEVEEWRTPEGPTEAIRSVRARRVQTFFRSTVLVSYKCRCALTDLAVPELLNASHIVPWSESTVRRADPRNGLCLNALHDRAFDRGFISFDESLRVMISPRMRDEEALGGMASALLDWEGHTLRVPDRFAPDPEALAFHREHVYLSA